MCLRSISGAYKSVVALYVSAPRLLPVSSIIVHIHVQAVKVRLWPGARKKDTVALKYS